MGTDFGRIQDAPAQIITAKVVSGDGEQPDYCLVEGYVTSTVGFELRLPETWNSRFLQVGCGGFCGGTRFSTETAQCDDAVRRGYTCVISDQGHKSQMDDGTWALDNLKGEVDYGFRAIHVTALAAKGIATRYYGAAPKWSYFTGCSGGGRQALAAAQKFPEDYDGIMANDPASRLCDSFAIFHWNMLATRGQDGQSLFGPTDIEALKQAVIAKCDMNDNVRDGVIGDPRQCNFDPVEIACTASRTKACLSPLQVEAARKIYSGPVDSKGRKIYLSHSVLGSEDGYFSFTSPERFSSDFMKYMAFGQDPGPDWDASTFDWDKDPQRMRLMSAIYEASNPDLRAYRDRGGKLLIMQGWHDDGTPFSLNTIDYYEMVQKAMGGEAATKAFARLFMIPGRAHCGGGPGANAIDQLSYLEAWVERGQAPDVLMARHVPSTDWATQDVTQYFRNPTQKTTFSRPIYAYPLQYRYSGRGDPNDPSSFVSVNPLRASAKPKP
nr:tannase/feruloyl esterase family alpha/beta hydrolase [Sphingobium boeckii]